MSMDLMTVEEVAAKLRLKRSWVYCHADELGVYRLGKYLRFSWPRVLECLDRRSASSGRSRNDSRQVNAQPEPDKVRETGTNR